MQRFAGRLLRLCNPLCRSYPYHAPGRMPGRRGLITKAAVLGEIKRLRAQAPEAK